MNTNRIGTLREAREEQYRKALARLKAREMERRTRSFDTPLGIGAALMGVLKLAAVIAVLASAWLFIVLAFCAG